MRINQATFHPDLHYHIFNRTNNKEKLFVHEDNYRYFLKKYKEYLNPVLTTYAYCLLGNHFHFLVKVRSGNELEDFRNTTRADSAQSAVSPKEAHHYHDIISHQFKRFFSTYTMAFNKQQSRSGSLFQRPYKRVLLNSEVNFANVIYYIHANLELHGVVSDFKEYRWSSFKAYLSDKDTSIPRNEVFSWFGNKEVFVDFHEEKRKLTDSYWVIE